MPGILTEGRRLFRRSAAAGLVGVFLLAACAGPDSGDRPALRRTLAAAGIELVDEEEAGVPQADRGRYVPCRSVPGFRPPPLPPHPAGYLIVGVEGGPEGDAKTILRVLSALEPGESVRLRVRRNPYLGAEGDWWEANVDLRVPRR